ncbi:MAG: FIST C-terminal domain-containing protein, partial [Synergistaceae bacterium]|nr:FIST C-terminal domain-containing protein [Synergistaceae bacterium]
ELYEQIESRGPLGKNSFGFVFCDAEVRHDEFMEYAKGKFPFELVGNTSIANLDTENGTQTMSATLLVLTGDDVAFSHALTDTLTAGNLESELRSVYAKASAACPESAKMLFLIPPFNDMAPLDNYVSILSECSGDIPIFGGLPSSNVADSDILMYADGRAFTDRAAIVLLGGDVRPIFSVKNVLSAFSQVKHTITEASENVVYRVDDMTFVDYLRKAGLSVDEQIAQKDLAVYVSTPLLVNLNVGDVDDGVPVVRTIKKLEPSDGSGVLFGAISKHSKVSLASMRRNDIQESAHALIADIAGKIGEASGDGYRYSTLFCVSCGGRYMVMADDNKLEGETLLQSLPSGINLAGFYAYGEICPTAIADGKALNRIHNESIVICAL